MSLLHYPSQPASPPEGVEGIGAHTDNGHYGEWIDAVPIPGCLVVNLGDQFACWTNDIFKSLHWAINATGQERYSIPVFFEADYDVKLEVGLL
ncbi:Clavaminate synthase [Tylopilus felleus]